MSRSIQIDGMVNRSGTQLDPALKGFLDAVLVPALVKEYLAELERENRLALVPEGVTESVPLHSASAEGVR